MNNIDVREGALLQLSRQLSFGASPNCPRLNLLNYLGPPVSNHETTKNFPVGIAQPFEQHIAFFSTLTTCPTNNDNNHFPTATTVIFRMTTTTTIFQQRHYYSNSTWVTCVD
eukprot:m.32818 g.32818  ORF g.32818 m.32818 type:complete len:112 (+) comp16703_c0_seq1:890-1225(+)